MERIKLVDRPPVIPAAGPRVESIQLVRVEPGHALVDADAPFEPEAFAAPHRFSARAKLFTGLVVVPMLAVTAYFFLLAADRYVSEASFIVRSAVYQGATAGAQVGGISLSHGAADLSEAVNTYLLSRDMVGRLERQDGLRDVLARGGRDFVYRFPTFWRSDDREQLYRHYLMMVDAEVDKAAGINTITVRTFAPEDSQRLANALLQHAEELINRLNERMTRDAEAYAQSAVDRARDRVVEVALQLANFRNSIGSVDPGRESATALDQIAQMTTELAGAEATLQQQMALSPSSPALPGLRERVRTFKEQIEKEKLKIVGADNSLTAKLAQFEKLTLDRQLAAREMDSALANLTTARQDAQRQRLYLQRISEPNLADEARYPRRLLDIAISFAFCFAFFVVVNAVYAGIREHRP
jgi:capsular polysaccharide transport system permease protein